MKILILSPIDQDAIRQLKLWHDVNCVYKSDPETLKREIADRDVLVFRSGVEIDAELMQQAPQLKALIRAGSGCDNVDLDYVHRQGITFVRIPQPGAKAVAELAFALMLALARQLLEADRSMRAGRWAKYQLTGYLLTGKVLGIVGAGNIGSRVGQLAAAWDMEVLGCVRHPSPSAAARLAEKGIRLTDLDEVLSVSDFVSIHVPRDDSTINLIDRAALRRMKPGAFLVNLARGGVVDESALREALERDGSLAGAALDVHEKEGDGIISPLAGLHNVILTPHIGASTVDSQREIGQRIVSLVNSLVPQDVHPATSET